MKYGILVIQCELTDTMQISDVTSDVRMLRDVSTDKLILFSDKEDALAYLNKSCNPSYSMPVLVPERAFDGDKWEYDFDN